MAEDFNQDTDTTTSDELDLDIDLGEDLEAVKTQAEKANAFAKQAIARAKKAEAEAKSLREKGTITNSQDQTRPSDILKSPEFRLHREGYTEDEIEAIMANGGPEILKNKTHIVTLGIEASKEQRRAEDAAAKATGGSGLSDIERKFTEQDMRNMTKEELAKLLPHTDN